MSKTNLLFPILMILILNMYGMEEEEFAPFEQSVSDVLPEITRESFSYPASVAEKLSKIQKNEIKKQLSHFDPKIAITSRTDSFKLAALYLAEQDFAKVPDHKFTQLLKSIYEIEKTESKKNKTPICEVLGCLTYNFDERIKHLHALKQGDRINAAYEDQKTIIYPAREQLKLLLQKKNDASTKLIEQMKVTNRQIKEHEAILAELKKTSCEQISKKEEIFAEEKSLHQADVILEKESMQRYDYLNKLQEELLESIEEKKAEIEILTNKMRETKINAKNSDIFEIQKQDKIKAEQELSSLEKETKDLEVRIAKFYANPSSTRNFGKWLGY